MQDTIVFFGSGPVAARSLELLVKDFKIEAVITKPQPPHHRGSFPVLDTAARLNIPVHTVSTKGELSALISQKPFASRLGILIDFGIIISQDVIDYFPLGIINSHFSVLPEWRGADPITFAILSGQPSTGVSIMLLVEKMDEGPLLAFGEYELPPDIDGPLLTEHLIHFSQALLVDIVPRYAAGNFQPAPQEVTKRQLSYSRKLTKEDGVIDWTKPAAQLEREIRAFIEWPKSRTTLGGKDVVITKATVVDEAGTPGSIMIRDKQLFVGCGTQTLRLEKLKPAGKAEMTAAAFLAGYGRLLK